MKKVLLSLAVFSSSLALVNAQETEPNKVDYNRWSIELNGGITKPTNQFTSGVYTERVAPLHLDLGVRYMFNPKFGLKLDGGYDQFESGDNSTADFESKFYRFSLQGVVNIGRVLNFEDWTNTIGLLGHAGMGYSFLDGDHSADNDQMLNFIAGLTGQVKLSDRFVLTGDFSAINTMNQDKTWDGLSNTAASRGFEKNLIFNASIGVTVYLGKNDVHADWYTHTPLMNELDNLESRVAEIEGMLVDSDQDGIPDYLDLEPNSTPGVAVDTRGRTIDHNGNGIPDELEGYLEERYGVDAMKSALAGEMKDNNELVRELINRGYVTTYFDFDKDQPTNVSSHGIDFMRTYLLNNPSASIDILGHADEIGSTQYNYGLANRRAQNVKNILVKAGI